MVRAQRKKGTKVLVSTSLDFCSLKIRRLRKLSAEVSPKKRASCSQRRRVEAKHSFRML